MEDGVDRPVHEDEVRDVVPDEAEALFAGEVRDVAGVARRVVVEPDDLVPLGEKTVAEMAAEESGGAGDAGPHPLPTPV